MRCTTNLLALLGLSVSLGLSQTASADVTLSLANLRTAQDLAEVATSLRTVLEIKDLKTDEQSNAVLLQSSQENLAAAQWLVHQLDQPAGVQAVGPDYQIACADKWRDCLAAGGEVIRVFHLKPSISAETLTALVTSIRTVADVQRLMRVEGSKAIVVRGTLLKANAAEWILRQLTPPDAKLVSGDSSTYRMGRQPPLDEEESIRIFHIDPASSLGKLVGIVTTIRTICDVQRLMPVETGRAILARASAEKLAATEWLVRQMNTPSHPTEMVETTIGLGPREAKLNDYLLRVYFIRGTSRELNELSTQIHAAGVSRVFALSETGTLAVRGRTDQMALVQAIIDKAGLPIAGPPDIK